jgi:glycosyltransferase involved in cell wall biosynthesis
LRVLILVDCYYPAAKSSAKLVHDLAVEFCRRGRETVVLTPSDTTSEAMEISTEDGVTVVRVKTGSIKGVNRTKRAVNEARLSAILWRQAEPYLRQNPCDLILFYSPTIFFGSLVGKLKHLWNCPAYLILRDIFPDWAADAGVLRKGLLYRFFRGVAVQQFKIADVIGAQSPANVRYLAAAYPQLRLRPKVLFNWTALEERPLPRMNYRAQLGMGNKFVFLYGGNLGIAQDLHNIVRLAAQLSFRTDIFFLLVGDGSEVPKLQKRIDGHGLKNIRILPGVSQGEYLSLVSECDVGLISLDARLTSHNIPGKLLSYLYWGMPVLASVNPGNDLFALLQQNKAGFCFLNGDDQSLASAALQLADDANLKSITGRNARRLLEQSFSVERAVDQIFAHLDEAGIAVAAGRSNLAIATNA